MAKKQSLPAEVFVKRVNASTKDEFLSLTETTREQAEMDEEVEVGRYVLAETMKLSTAVIVGDRKQPKKTK